jgi:hypothetical protein
VEHCDLFECEWRTSPLTLKVENVIDHAPHPTNPLANMDLHRASPRRPRSRPKSRLILMISMLVRQSCIIRTRAPVTYSRQTRASSRTYMCVRVCCVCVCVFLHVHAVMCVYQERFLRLLTTTTSSGSLNVCSKRASQSWGQSRR